MPFINEITNFINTDLKAGSLNKEKLQPANFIGLSTIVQRQKPNSAKKEFEQLPAVIDEKGNIELIIPDKKHSIQVYHKLNGKTYDREKKNSVGDQYNFKMVADMSMLIIVNSEKAKASKEMLEPAIIFGMPQRLSNAVLESLKLNSCLIYPVSAILDHNLVAKQEYPQSQIFFDDNMSIFLIKYRIETIFSQACIDACLC